MKKQDRSLYVTAKEVKGVDVEIIGKSRQWLLNMTKEKFYYINSFNPNFATSYKLMLQHQDKIIKATDKLLKSGLNITALGEKCVELGINKHPHAIHTFKTTIAKYLDKKSKASRFEQCITVSSFLKIEKLHNLLQEEINKY